VTSVSVITLAPVRVITLRAGINPRRFRAGINSKCKHSKITGVNTLAGDSVLA
jgi:hypothetical protein